MITAILPRAATWRTILIALAPHHAALAARGATPATARTVAQPHHHVPYSTNAADLPDRTWIDSFTQSSIPSTAYTVSYARSSGPGGQNVNKVNTKAILKFHVDPRPAWLPEYAHTALMRQRAAQINKDGDLVVMSDRFRSQRQNVDDCVEKVFEMVKEAGYVPRETTAEQKRHVMKLQRAQNERRLESKKMAGKKKADRRGGGRGEW
ncbi:Peptidyl-tRNA hydrolase ict1, mitochondrial [Allomyces arbusculus]|nr:Peptidyl-tRNA hydrolase ict1, mitochondrial [Allomyces arbusculus]